MSRQDVKYIAVARRRDGVVLAQSQLTTDKAYNFAGNTAMLLTSGNLDKISGDRLVLKDDPNTFYLYLAGGLVCVCVCSSSYPIRAMYATSPNGKGLLHEIYTKFTEACGDGSSGAAGYADAKARPIFKAIAEEYNDLSRVDKLAEVEGKIAAVTSVMEDNVKRAIDGVEKVKNLDEKTEHLRDSASAFQRAGRTLHRDQRCRYYKRLAVYGGIALVLLAVIIIIIVVSTGAGQSK